MIPEHLKVPHIEVNEDNISFEHPGYAERACRKCGRVFIMAKTATAILCNDPKCGKEGTLLV